MDNFSFNQRYRAAQIGTLGMLVGFRFKRAIVGSLLWSYFVCPEVFNPVRYTTRYAHAEAAQDQGSTMAQRGDSEDIEDQDQLQYLSR